MRINGDPVPEPGQVPKLKLPGLSLDAPPPAAGKGGKPGAAGGGKKRRKGGK